LKDYLKDYATAAFRFYAKNGKSAEEYKKRIHDEALETIKRREVKTKGSGGSPTEAMLIEAERMISDKMAEIKDMEAVEATLRQLEVRGSNIYQYVIGKDIIKAIEYVYFKDADKEIIKGDIYNRVHAAEIDIHASERSIYYWLRQAREIFAIERGLRVEKRIS
jgi:hypothetical protein